MRDGSLGSGSIGYDSRSCGVLAALFTLGLSLWACGDDTGTGGGTGGEPSAGGGGSPATGGGGATSGGGGAGGQEPFIPTPEDVQFQSVNPMPLGEWLVFNDWNPAPNEVLVMRPDGTDEVTVFRAYRVWSLATSRDQNRIAFSAGDPEQEAHYGVTLGDAIQPTFIYDATLEAAENLTYGNINDECLRFGPGDKFLYLCRRAGFAGVEPPEQGYRVGRVDLETREFAWLTGLDPESFALNPEPSLDETQLYFTRIPLGETRFVARAPLPNATPEESFLDAAGAPRLSADGTKMLYNDYGQAGALLVVDLQTLDKTLIAEGEVGTARWSPDGNKVAFLRWDNEGQCSHVEITDADGSTLDTPTRIHDCVDSGRFVTQLEWVLR